MELSFKQLSQLQKALELAKSKIANDIKESLKKSDNIEFVVSVYSHYEELKACLFLLSSDDNNRKIDITSEDIEIGSKCSKDMIEYAKYIQSVLKKYELKTY